MPLPKPHSNEDKSKFISRCMGDSVMVREYGSQKQRFAVCNSIFENKEKDMAIKITESDFRSLENDEDEVENKSIVKTVPNVAKKKEEVEDLSDMVIVKMTADEDIKYENTIVLTLSDRKGITALFEQKKREILAYFFDKSAGWDEIRAKEWLKENKNYNGETEVDSFKFFKKDSEKKIVYGAVLVPYEMDLQGDIETPDSIEQAAHKFLSGFQTIGEMHDKFKGIGDLKESYIAPVDFMMNGVHIKKGSWIIATKATDEVWEKIKSGELTGYSIGYSARRIEENV